MVKAKKPRGFFIVIALVAIVVMGIVPNFFFEKMESSVARVIERSAKVEMVATAASRGDAK